MEDPLNLAKILVNLGFKHRLWGSAGVSIVVEGLSDEIEKIFALLANDVRESYAVVVAAVDLLSYVYLYLTGCGGWDASRAVSSGPLDYRDTYIAIVLFRGAYVWIKFRDVASTKPIPAGAIKPSGKDGRIKYEPRFKPRKENDESFNRIYLGQFDSPADAEVVFRMAASCYDYGKDYGTPLDLAGDGRELFTIIPEFTPAEKTLSGKPKQELVKKRVQELYKRYKTKKDALNLPPTLPGANLEQELQNRRLQSEVLSEQQQKEDLARQLQQSQILQQAQRTQIQNLQLQVEALQRQVQDQQAQQLQLPNSQLQVEGLQRPVQDHQAQRNLMQAPQFRMEGLERQVRHPQAQQNFQEAQQFQFQNSQLQIEDLQRPVQDQQAQRNLMQAPQFRMEGLERQVQHPQAQQNFQQAQQFQFQNSQLQVEDLQRPVQDQQAQQNLLQAQQDLLQALQFRIEGLERQVQHQQAQQNFQQAQQFQFQNSQLHVEDLQRPVQYQQAQRNLQPPQQFQVPNLQPQPQLPHLQQQQREEEPLTIEEIWGGF